MELSELVTVYGPLGLGWVFAWSKDRELSGIRKELLESVRADAQAKAMLQSTLDRLVTLVEATK